MDSNSKKLLTRNPALSLCAAILLSLPTLTSAEITESDLIKLAKEESLVIAPLSARSYQAKANLAAFNQGYSPLVTSSVKSENSNQPPFLLQSPSYESSENLQLSIGYAQQFKYGLSISGGMYSSETSFSKFNAKSHDVLGSKLGIEIDLWKNLLGRLTRLSETYHTSNTEKSNQLKAIKINQHVQDVRSLFWTAVANKKLQELRQQLIKSAERQTIQAKKQKSLYVSDKGDVTRFTALREVQKSALIFLRYKREQIDSSLKNFFPSLRGKKLSFKTPDLDKAGEKVMLCISKISQSAVPHQETTTWSGIISNSMLMSKTELMTNKSHSSVDVKLSAAIDHSNQKMDVQSEDQLTNDPYQKSSLALTLTYPLGRSASNTEKWKGYALEKKSQAEVNSYKATIETTHEKTLQLIKLLIEVLRSQLEVNKLNKSNLALSRTKFERAELPLINLISDETTYLTGKIAEIETKLLVITTLLDYLKVFDKFKCDFNRN